MKCIRSITELPQLSGGAVTIGNFDGVHRGHRRIIERLKEKSAKHNGPSVVFTFDPHPVRLLRPEQTPPPLTWTTRKADLFAELGVEGLVAYPTSHDLLKLTPREFFEQIMVGQLNVRAMVEGPNFFFGKDRSGDIDVLKQLCDEHDVDLEIVEPLVSGDTDDDTLISSSRVRAAIADGNVDEARKMLTQPYRLRGMVTHGAARGAQIGFPTANLDAIDTLIPAIGVYAGRAYVGDDLHAAAIHIGPNPTFGETAVKVEVHLIDFNDDLYGKPLEVDFLKRLRGISKFNGVDELVAQLKNDVLAAKASQPSQPQ